MPKEFVSSSFLVSTVHNCLVYGVMAVLEQVAIVFYKQGCSVNVGCCFDNEVFFFNSRLFPKSSNYQILNRSIFTVICFKQLPFPYFTSDFDASLNR